ALGRRDAEDDWQKPLYARPVLPDGEQVPRIRPPATGPQSRQLHLAEFGARGTRSPGTRSSCGSLAIVRKRASPALSIAQRDCAPDVARDELRGQGRALLQGR